MGSEIFEAISPSVYLTLIKKSGIGLLVSLSIFLRGHKELTKAANFHRSSMLILSLKFGIGVPFSPVETARATLNGS